MRLGSFLFCLILSQSLHAQQSGEFDWKVFSSLRKCLAGKGSFIDPVNYAGVPWAGGQMFLLDQREPSLSCPAPRGDIIAIARQVGEGSLEIMTLTDGGWSPPKVQRLQISLDDAKKRKVLELPDSEGTCNNSMWLTSSRLFQSRVEPVRVQLWTWKVEGAEGQRAKDPVRRISLQHVGPKKDQDMVAPGSIQTLENPHRDEVYEAIFQNLSLHWEALEHRMVEMSAIRGEIQDQLKHCKQAQDHLDEKIKGSGNVRLLTAAERSRRAVYDAYSIMVEPQPGYRTIRDYSQSLAPAKPSREEVAEDAAQK